MNRKQLFIIILLLALSISFVACNPNGNPPEKIPADAVEQESNSANDLVESDASLTAPDWREPDPTATTDDHNEETKPEDNTQDKPTESPLTPPDAPTEGTTKPDNTVENPTEPTITTEPAASNPEPTAEAYANYHKMSGEEQQKFIDSFDSIEAFFTWLNTAKKAYEENRTPIDGFTPIIP